MLKQLQKLAFKFNSVRVDSSCLLGHTAHHHCELQTTIVMYICTRYIQADESSEAVSDIFTFVSSSNRALDYHSQHLHMSPLTMLQLDHCLLWDTRAQSRVLSTVDSGLTNLIHRPLQCFCEINTIGWPDVSTQA